MDCFLFSRDTSRVKSVSIIGLRTDRSTGFSARDAIASKKREGLEKRKLHVSGEEGWSRWNSQTLRSRFRSTKRNALPIRPSSILAFCQSGPCRHILLCSKQFFLEVLNPQTNSLRWSSKMWINCIQLLPTSDWTHKWLWLVLHIYAELGTLKRNLDSFFRRPGESEGGVAEN